MDTLFSVWPLDERSNLNWRMGEPGPHCHPFHQVFFILRGSGSHWVDGEETRIHGPWVMLVAKGKKHLYLPDTQDEGWMFDFGEDFLDQGASWVFSDFLASPNLPLPKDDLCQQAATLARLMWDIGKIKSDEARPVLRHLLSAFLHLLQSRIRERGAQNQAHLSSEFKLFQAFLQQLDSHFGTEKDVEFYARKLRCTTRRLGAVCKLVLGKTPQNLIIERCMLEAKRLLLNSDLSVQQIAAELGSEDQSNFTKAFRKATGETPSGYRKSRSLSVPAASRVS
ncbi:AraC family transcriptional regulator [Geothrix sp. PMB-07]|uniref:helix-turn-helix domain-containing protein n=1 Tax=Geothrix sp. PMB-07 TaxID=3068640 RepID=UPI002741CEDD|nr:AraC family transcriptional regulator [Geothrix sp. PMB-07]WLT31043.1 AraC family transcriptional regulator [Geothrix sp. PMB-07]